MLAGYGGMISLAQMTVAGLAGYMVAILGDNSVGVMGLGWPWWLTIIVAISLAGVFSAFIGRNLSSDRRDLYNHDHFGDRCRVLLLRSPELHHLQRIHRLRLVLNLQQYSGSIGRDPIPFYYLTLTIAALALGAVFYISRSTFGLTLQAIRDNPRRMSSLGFNVVAHRISPIFSPASSRPWPVS